MLRTQTNPTKSGAFVAIYLIVQPVRHKRRADLQRMRYRTIAALGRKAPAILSFSNDYHLCTLVVI